jgi:TonB-dependent siderophore receptor
MKIHRSAVPVCTFALVAIPFVAMSQETQQMSKIKVQAPEVTDASTEGSGYAAPATTLGKGVQSLRELPHSVTIITRQQLTDQNINTIESALKNVTGVTIQRYDATGTYTQFIARGYAADTYQLDGLNLQTDTNGIYFDLAAYDRVEVQRGAAGLFSGVGEPGVTVNMARKRAWSDFHFDGGLTVGSWNDRRVDLDLNTPLNDDGSVRGRLVGVLQNFDTFMDGIDDNKKRLIYGTLETDLTEQTTVSLGVTWQNVDTVLSRGLPTFANAQLIDMPRSTMPVMDWNYQELDSKSAFVELEHRSDDDAFLKVALRHLQRTNDAAYLDPSVPTANGTMNALSVSAFEREDTDNSLDVYYSKPLTWGGQTHNLLIGADYRRSKNETDYAPYTGLVSGSINLFNVDHRAIPKPNFDYTVNVSDTEVTSYGAYTQLRYKVASAWTLIGGGRLSWWESESVANRVPSGFDANSEFTPYAAAIWDVTPSIAVYTSYNEIFKPQNARTISGDQIEPRTGKQVELGLKGEALEGQLSYTAALYRLVDENRAIADPANINFSIPSGKARAQGFEIDTRGEITPQWSVSGGYAYTETKYLRSTPAQQGQPISSFTPKHSGNLWIHHTLNENLVRGVELGFGLRSVSDFYNGTGAQLIRGPGYTVFQLGASYDITAKYRLALNVDNLFDKNYWEKVSGITRQNFFGEPRRISVSLRGSF